MTGDVTAAAVFLITDDELKYGGRTSLGRVTRVVSQSLRPFLVKTEVYIQRVVGLGRSRWQREPWHSRGQAVMT